MGGCLFNRKYEIEKYENDNWLTKCIHTLEIINTWTVDGREFSIVDLFKLTCIIN